MVTLVVQLSVTLAGEAVSLPNGYVKFSAPVISATSSVSSVVRYLTLIVLSKLPSNEFCNEIIVPFMVCTVPSELRMSIVILSRGSSLGSPLNVHSKVPLCS